MNVPHARSRISLAPSPVKKGGRVRQIPPVSGEGIFDVVKSVGKAVAPVAIDLASSYAKKKVGGATKKYIPKRKLQGGSFMPAGGSIYPAGMYGKGIDNPIQLGSPYQYSNSPAMSPFIPDRSIQSYNPIKSKENICYKKNRTHDSSPHDLLEIGISQFLIQQQLWF